jgi:hypothetical protein
MVASAKTVAPRPSNEAASLSASWRCCGVESTSALDRPRRVISLLRRANVPAPKTTRDGSAS